MRTLEIFHPKKNETWKSKIEGLKIGAQFICSFEKVGTVRPLISREIAVCYPNRVFKTYRSNMHGIEVLVVSRSADRQLVECHKQKGA